MSEAWLAAEWSAPETVMAGTTLRAAADFALPAAPSWLKQVHGARVVRIGSDDFAGGPPKADAVVADRAGAICVVRTADCLPILMCSADGREIAAIHAGWRGLVAGVIEATLAALSSRPRELLAWFGPAISQPAYEVGDEVRDAFIDADPGAAKAFVANPRGRWQADLYQLAAQRLLGAGVTTVHGGGLCTFGDERRFFSYRRDRTTGRHVSFIFRRN